MSDPTPVANDPAQPADLEPVDPRLVVVLGASAGGIEALQQFFGAVPPDSRLAYVVVLHLSPDYDSQLTHVLQAATTVPVHQVTESVRLQANRAYVIPPNHVLTCLDGELVPTEVTRKEQRRAPVDLLMRSVADAFGTRAVAVVLSGTGADGTSGMKRVKEHGGLAVAQDPATAQHPDMPQNAIATDLVDLVLHPSGMPAALVQYAGRLEGTEQHQDIAPDAIVDPDTMREILTVLRVRTGHDFSNYKPATVLRRIQRRLNVRQLATLSEYARAMREHPEEPQALMKDLLISVTNFFRDPKAFESLQHRVIPALFERRRGADQVRVWSAGCATGEEAYSLGILLAEHAATMLEAPQIQVFGTDLDGQAIAAARDGIYADAEVADVSDERLRRFFSRTADGFRVSRELREMVLFAQHNVIKDPPFSHLDLVVCRNLLIYLNRSVQERLMETFHFALRPGRFLFLGQSESPEAGTDLYATVDKSAHLYEARSASTRLPIAVETFAAATPLPQPRALHARSDDRVLPADLHQRLLEEYAAPSILVTDEFKVVHISQNAARYLRVPGGEFSRDVSQLIRPELRTDLRAALLQATRERTHVDVHDARIDLDGTSVALTIRVRPVLRQADAGHGYLLVLFEEDHGAENAASVQFTSSASEDIAHLDDELTQVRLQLRSTIEQYETQVEEAKAGNEELQALNEELRSSAEELETSKEELQSVNEELTTVNQELKIKIEELALTNNDFQNFINSTDIAAIFLDKQLRVKLFTPRVRAVFNLMPSDTGRSLFDITHQLAYEGLRDDVASVLERLQTVERQVTTAGGQSYIVRVLPYRTSDDCIDGVVITFVDVSGRLDAEERVRRSEERLRLLIESAIDYAIFTITADGRIDSWNAGAERVFGYTGSEIVGQPVDLLFTPEDRAAGVPAQELKTALENGRAADERWHLRKGNVRFYSSGVTTSLGGDPFLGYAKIARDLTPQRQAQLQLEEAHADLEERVRERTDALQAEVIRRTMSQDEVVSLLRRLVTSQEDQRARIARDLHDQLGQQLTALRLALARHREQIAGTTAVEELDRAMALAEDVDAAVDFLAWELRPATLDHLGLAAALPQYIDEWSSHQGLAARFEARGVTAGHLSPEAETTFYRVAQEALNNVVKHAHATRVDVLLERRDDEVVLVVEDDGIGFDAADPAMRRKGIGLLGMRERAALIGATLDVESAPGAGATVFLRCRLQQPAAEATGGT